MRLYAVVFNQSFVKVQLSAVYGDVHTAVVKGRHRGGRQRDVSWYPTNVRAYGVLHGGVKVLQCLLQGVRRYVANSGRVC